MFSKTLLDGAILAAACAACLWSGASWAYLGVFGLGMSTSFVEIVRRDGPRPPPTGRLGEGVALRAASGLIAVLALVVLQETRHAAADPTAVQVVRDVVAAVVAATLLIRLPLLAEAGFEPIRDL